MLLALLLVGCGQNNNGGKEATSSGDFSAGNGMELKIVAGSELKELEPIIEDYAVNNRINISIDYKGSLDIMRMLQHGEMEYDGVWPANSMWLSMGDTKKLLKHEKTTSITPIVFGIKKSKAEELGFVGKEVFVRDIMDAISEGKLKFAMNSATQSNSGASAYLGFLNSLDPIEGGLTIEDLEDKKLQEDIKLLLSGVNRSSGSSGWLKDLFLTGEYDAMVNYETMMIQANLEFIKRGEEPIYIIYPRDGLTFSDSPLAYVDKGDSKKEEAFLKFQDYILSDEAQKKIMATGRRDAFNTVTGNEEIFNKDWGIITDEILTATPLPQPDVINTALYLYQSSFKKPSYTVYILDYSGSMEGDGNYQLVNALYEVLIPARAKSNLLQGTEKDITYFIPFESKIRNTIVARGNGEELERAYEEVKALKPNGGTKLYKALEFALEEISKEDLTGYSPAIVILYDGMTNDGRNKGRVRKLYEKMGLDIPIFSIAMGEADMRDLEEIASWSRARVFNGKGDLISAFKDVKGYN